MSIPLPPDNPPPPKTIPPVNSPPVNSSRSIPPPPPPPINSPRQQFPPSQFPPRQFPPRQFPRDKTIPPETIPPGQFPPVNSPRDNSLIQCTMYPCSIIISSNSVDTTYPNSDPSGCLFHLSKNIYKRVQEEGLQVPYNKNVNDLQTNLRMLAALAFVPENDVEQSFNMLRNHCGQTEVPVLDYFQRTCVGVPDEVVDTGG